MEVIEKSLNSELWHACAGGMVRMPHVNSKVFYFPQGHAEHTLTTVDFSALPRIPALILCRVAAVKFLADPETDEVYAKISLIPIGNSQYGFNDELLLESKELEPNEKPTSFAKTLTQSDANNGGGFSVPRYCAETIFPKLDYTDDPPVQNVIARDVQGRCWKFRHIYRGTPRRHLLTTGWSSFVNQKKLVAGDSIVFLRAENGELCVGIRRAKRGGGGNLGVFSSFLKNDVMCRGVVMERGKVRPESVVESCFLAANGQPFEVVYYPRASTPEFVVKASTVSAAMRNRWGPGMRFKMAFETEDSSRISWFMGTVDSAGVKDPIRWPHSPWRLLQVTWDEPDLLQNVTCVSPWLVEMVTNMPLIHISPFSPPRKKSYLPHQYPNFPPDNQFPIPSFSVNPFGPNAPLFTAGIQAARHAQIGVPVSDFHLSNKLQMGLLRLDPLDKVHCGRGENENISCLLSMGGSSCQKPEKIDHSRTPLFLLFGQPILTEQQMSHDGSNSSDGTLRETESFDHEGQNRPNSFHTAPFGHCKVFLESEDVGRILDLCALGSYEELYKRLGHMFGIEQSEIASHVFYRDVRNDIKQTGDEPFSEFVKTAKRLTIHMPNSNGGKRKLFTGFPTAERGLDSSNQAGPLSIFA